jgi:hypothetical protein
MLGDFLIPSLFLLCIDRIERGGINGRTTMPLTEVFAIEQLDFAGHAVPDQRNISQAAK